MLVQKLIPLIVLMLGSGQNLSITKGITPKLCNRELWFLYTARFLVEIYLPMKFQVDTFYNFSVMLRTKFKYEK